MYSIKREIRHFNVVVVQKRAQKCTEKREKLLFFLYIHICGRTLNTAISKLVFGSSKVNFWRELNTIPYLDSI